jgi:hypothetical protein
MAKTKKVVTMDLERYVQEMRGKGLCVEKRHDYVTLCPECYLEKKKKGETNYRNLKLWIDKDLQYSQCWRCGTVFLSENETINTSIRRIEPPINMNNWTVSKLSNEGYWSLDRFNEFDEDDEIGVEYLAKKRFYLYRKMYKALGIRFKDHNPVVPFYYKGELIFYQMRIIDPESKIKYYTPPTTHKNPYILEHGENKKFVICEGVFDAIACRILYPDRTPFAVLGSDITPYQIAMLRTYCPEDILIYMDKTEISNRIKDSIIEYLNYADISIRPSFGQDPEEFLKQQLLEESF